MNATASTWQSGWTNLSRSWAKVSTAQLTFALALIAVAVRLLGLGARPLWLDEAYSAWFASRGWHELWTSVPRYEPHPPFYYSILKLWRSVFGGDAVALRSLSVVFAAAAIAVVLAAVREQEGLEPSGNVRLRVWTAGILAACAPMLVETGQEVRPYPLLVLAYSVGILGLLRLMREFRDGGPGTWRSWAILGGGTELSLWSHSLGILYGFALFAALVASQLSTPAIAGRLKRSAITVGLALLLYLPCALMVAARMGDWSSGWLHWQPSMLLTLLSLYTFPFESPWIALFGAAAMVVLAKRAIAAGLVRRWTSDSALVLLWLLPPLLSVTISATLIPIFLPRTLCATLIPAYLAMAGAAARTQSSRERLFVSVALALSLAVCAVDTALRPPLQRWDEVSTYIAGHVHRADQVWVYPNDSALPLAEAERSLGQRYGFRQLPAPYPAVGSKGPVRAGSPAVVSLTRQRAYAVARDPALAGVPTIWLVTRQSPIFDPDGDLPSALGTVRTAGDQKSWDEITVQPYRLARAETATHPG